MGVAWLQAVSSAGHPSPQGLILTQEVRQPRWTDLLPTPDPESPSPDWLGGADGRAWGHGTR